MLHLSHSSDEVVDGVNCNTVFHVASLSVYWCCRGRQQAMGGDVQMQTPGNRAPYEV